MKFCWIVIKWYVNGFSQEGWGLYYVKKYYLPKYSFVFSIKKYGMQPQEHCFYGWGHLPDFTVWFWWVLKITHSSSYNQPDTVFPVTFDLPRSLKIDLELGLGDGAGVTLADLEGLPRVDFFGALTLTSGTSAREPPEVWESFDFELSDLSVVSPDLEPEGSGILESDVEAVWSEVTGKVFSGVGGVTVGSGMVVMCLYWDSKAEADRIWVSWEGLGAIGFWSFTSSSLVM